MNEFEIISKSVVRMLNGGGWIRWVHSGTNPATTNAEKTANIVIGVISSHCARCLNLNGCCFPENNMPPLPLHPNCHCFKEYILTPVPNKSAFAICPLEKIKNYIFVKKGKKDFFENNGYDIFKSEQMKNEIERQAAEKYCNNEFELGVLSEHGQRITILIELSLFGEKPLTFLTGWMVYPDGKIMNTTPLASGDKKLIKKFKESNE